MDRQELLKRLDKAWADLNESYAGLSESEMTGPDVMGDWSVKDILGHVTTWEEEALKYLPLVIQGEKTPRYSTQFGGVDAFNARMSAEKRELSLAEVLCQLAEVHDRLVRYAEMVSEEQYLPGTRFRRRLRLDTYGHYPIHARAIREWRQRSDR